MVLVGPCVLTSTACADRTEDGPDGFHVVDDDTADDDTSAPPDDDGHHGDDDGFPGDEIELPTCGSMPSDAVVPDDHPDIATAIEAAADGDVICVEAGEYLERIEFGGKAIRLVGVAGPDVTIIDGQDTGTVVSFEQGEGPDSILEGFTVIDGHATGAGGAIRVVEASPTLDAVILKSSTAWQGGGGLYLRDSHAILVNVVINNCNAVGSHGGGIYLHASSIVMDRVIIGGNHADDAGGGLYLDADSSAQMSNVVIGGNTAETGAGLAAYGPFSMTNGTVLKNGGGERAGGMQIHADAELLNTIVVANEGRDGGGVTVEPSESSQPVVTLAWCNVFGNSPTDFAGIPSPVGGDGNVAAMPYFLFFVGTDPLKWNLRLSTFSPMVESGTPDLLDPDGSNSDMGAYGGPAANAWDKDRDLSPAWWQPGDYDQAAYPWLGLDCDDWDPYRHASQGCEEFPALGS
jgi:hypothetical protein